MDIYLKSLCIAIVGIVLCLILSGKAKDYTFVVVVILCCALSSAAIGFLKPVLALVEELAQMVDTSSGWIEILFKTVGLSMIGETISLICIESGHTAVGKTLQLLTTMVILWVCLPLVRNLMDLIRSILEML